MTKLAFVFFFTLAAFGSVFACAENSKHKNHDLDSYLLLRMNFIVQKLQYPDLTFEEYQYLLGLLDAYEDCWYRLPLN